MQQQQQLIPPAFSIQFELPLDQQTLQQQPQPESRTDIEFGWHGFRKFYQLQ